ncbi:protein LATERAL BRANCHING OXIDOREDUCTASE 1-like [Silene latifolia]|uniref:protein LATERAL BRANCHING OXIDOREDUCTASE 1-like n=1 Tax=Silene latifolia TaxID=37657 RepID=UPI003D76F58F
MTTNTLVKEDVGSKLAQEIAKKGDEIPERFILKYPEIIIPAIDAPSNLWENDLLIDYSLLSSSHRTELLKFSSALKEWGCFQVINHGMTNLYLDDLVKITKQFFSLPLEEKLKSSTAGDFFNGYGLAGATPGTKSLNWSDRMFLTVYPEDQRKLQLWPENPLGIREILHDFSVRQKMMLDGFLKAMAQSLDLEENNFSEQHGDQGAIISTRLGLYPRCPCPDRVYGIHPHSDRSTLTIILQDNDMPEGLHIQKDDQWFKVPVIPGAFFVNIGDFAEVMSNGIFKSAVHRVVTNSEKERVSLAAFCSPDPENQAEPIPQLVTTNQPKMHKKTYKQLFVEPYPHGKRAIDALRI